MKAKRIIKSGLALLLSMQLALMSCITALAAPEWPSDTGVLADIGIAVDADSGAVLFGQGIHELTPPASITKLLTALVVVENSSMDDMVTFSYDAVNNVESGSGNKKNIAEGDKLSVKDCLYLLLLQSSNQAANALAEHVAGSRDAFADMMNEKVKELGCTDGTHFANPSGLNDDTQVVSAYDMAIIARAAFNNSDVLEISSTKSYKLAPTQNNPSGATCANEHRLIITDDETSELYCPEAKAGKTGYTSLAGNTLVTYGEKDGRRVISVVLKGQPSPNYFLDGKTLLQFGFENFQNVSIPDNETKYVTGEETVSINGADFQPDELDLESGAVITLPKDAAFSDASMELVTELPEQHPERAVALLQYTYNDRKIGQAYLLAKEGSLPASSEETGGAAPEEKLDGKTDASDQKGGEEGSIALPPLSLPVIGICLLVFAVLLLSAYTLYTKKKEAEELRRRHERRMQRLKEENYTEEEFYELLGREKERLAGKRSQKRSSGSRPKKAEKKARSPKQMKTEGESPDESLENLDDLFFEDLDSSEENKNNFDI
jgi:serine-type D-Ala-D-Ala carboxypeptidase (penicillin-binding protein 5/6)